MTQQSTPKDKTGPPAARGSSQDKTDLPDDIRLRIENSGYKDVIMEIVPRLQSEGVTMTRDVVAAIVATLEVSEGVIE